ncbi:hypothetical protein OC844_005691 [Tilletia horrida]|nr:hypothetical protein OC844_005691 [Tilletia horrida]
MSSDERQPLIASSSQSSLDASGAKKLSEGLQPRRGSRFPLPLRIAVVKLIADLTLQAAGAVLLDVLRAWNCAAMYEQNPQNALWNEPNACRSPEVEMVFATWFKYVQVGGSLLSALMIPFYGRLLRYGRKPVLVFVLLAATISPTLPALLLPFSPPVSDDTSFISASAVKVVFSACTVIVGLCSTDLLPTLVLRTMMVDISSPSDRTKNFTLMHTALLLGGIIGPGLGAIVSLAPQAEREASPEAPKFVQGMPTPRRGVYLMTLAFYLFGVLFTIFFIPETKPAETTRVEEEENEGAVEQQSGGRAARVAGVMKSTLTSLNVLLPTRTDPSVEPTSTRVDSMRGKLDWRVTKVAASWGLFLFSTLTFGVFAVFLGFRWKVTGGQLSTLLTGLNIIRALGLIFALPHIVKALERTTRRPAELQGLTLEELKAMDRAFKQDEQAQDGPVSGVETSEAEGEDHARDRAKTKSALLRWRTTIDLRLTRIGLGADAAAWALITLAAASGSPALAVTSLAGAGLCLVAAPVVIPAFSAAAVSIVGIVHSPESVPSWLAALSLLEGLSGFVAPLISFTIYQLTLSTIPWLIFLLTAGTLTIALLLTSSVHA